MGTMGLALPWEHRIPPVPRDRERRVEPFREPAIPTGPVGLDPAAEAARAEGVAIAREMLLAVRHTVQGAQISAPQGRYSSAVDVLEALGTKSPAVERTV